MQHQRYSQLKFRTIEEHQNAIEKSRSRSRSPAVNVRVQEGLRSEAALPADNMMFDIQNKLRNKSPQTQQDVLTNYDQTNRNRLEQDFECNMPRQMQSTQQLAGSVSPQITVLTSEVETLRRRANDADEVANYYKRMAEDYRAKFLAMEREFNYLKNTHELDIEKKDQEQAQLVQQMNDKLQFEQM